MRTIRLHLVGILLAMIGIATSMPQPPIRLHGQTLRNPSQVQLDDDDDDREAELAIIEDEMAIGGASSVERRRRA